METLFIGRQRIEPQEVSSTNSMALDLLKTGTLNEGAVVITKNQTAGRGQRGNSWESEPGKNLSLSFVLKPVFLPLASQFDLTRVVSLAVAALVGNQLKAETLPIKIKWPNDIYVGDRKIAGILIENTVRENQITATVAGIGLNINQTQFSEGLNACSLTGLTGKNYDIEACFEMLCSELEVRYMQLKNGKQEKLRSDYHKLLYRLHENQKYSSVGRPFQAKVIGVSEKGFLQLQLEDGSKKEFDLKELVFIKDI
jgi:BirA family biotin operon repressor/biotin-[acetyl-CoA-carboxylase] ligase